MSEKSSARTKARKRALDLLFEADLRELDPLLVLADRVDGGETKLREFTVQLVRGVADTYPHLDDWISQCLAPGWTLGRMPRVDRNLARIATYELAYSEVPSEIIIAEAVKLGGELSTDNSPAFLNGLLSSVAARVREEETR